MRSLVILRGSPGSGKSTWIKNMELENYTLSADAIRMLVESPIITPEGYKIAQKNDSYVWALLFELLEKRMERGEFVIIDATHSRSSDFSRYNQLCEKYRYRRYFVDFSDIDIETCKKQNLMRPSYKQVPETVIDKMYSRLRTQSKTSGWVKVDRNNFWDEIGFKLFDFNKYEQVHVFGDIHGCYTPLKKYFEKYPYTESDFYLFCGDYLDRGIENKKTLEFLMDLSAKPNVLMLEGNHERWLRMYANDNIGDIRSHIFLKRTVPQLSLLDPAEIRTFCRKIGQVANFEFAGNKYLVTHGGLSYIPEEIQLVATEQFINGVGDYNVDIDEIFANNYTDTIQIHGHRNTYEIDDVECKSFNLEGKVEFGGFLKVLQLSKNGGRELIKIKNDVFGGTEYEVELGVPTLCPKTSYLQQLRESNFVKENMISDTISSFNFTRNAFYKRQWDDITTKARGLFVDTVNEKVVARGYDKFFNIGERRETEITTLANTFKGKKITCYKKYNGFLGIMSLVDDELFVASKSTDKGEFAGYFRNIFENSGIDNEALKKYLKTKDVSLTFEVIDPVNDPHIIKYDNSRLILLDIIKNNFTFEKLPYSEVLKLSDIINCPCKEIYKEFDDFRSFHKWYLEETDEDNLSQENLEGVVIECDGFMTKLKFPYYNFWKFMRSLKENIARGGTIKLSRLYNDKANYFYDYCKKLSKDKLCESIISLRENFEKEGQYNLD